MRIAPLAVNHVAQPLVLFKDPVMCFLLNALHAKLILIFIGIVLLPALHVITYSFYSCCFLKIC